VLSCRRFLFAIAAWFNIYRVPAGRYTIVAVSKLKDKARTDADLVDRLRMLATSIEFAGDTNQVKLTLSEW